MRRIVIVAIACLLALPDPSWACPGAFFNQKPFPAVGVKYFIADDFFKLDRALLTTSCLGLHPVPTMCA
jgi:hypothetical protein